MKLLDKREIDRARNRERALEVEQGRALAVRVDSLRELYSKEQGSLAKFRDETVAMALSDVKAAVQRRDIALEELRVAEEERDAAKGAVDLRVATFERREAELLAGWNGVTEAAKGVNAAIQAVEEASRNADAARTTAISREKEARRLQDEAVRLRNVAQAQSDAASKVLSDSKEQARQRMDEVSRKEEEVSKREGAATSALVSIAGQTRALSLRERDIIDREEQLARELKRQGK